LSGRALLFPRHQHHDRRGHEGDIRRRPRRLLREWCRGRGRPGRVRAPPLPHPRRNPQPDVHLHPSLRGVRHPCGWRRVRQRHHGNTAAGDCCSSTRQFDPAGAACTGTNPCLTATTCDGAGVCGGGTPTPGTCNDGNACTTADTCAGGVCVGGPALNCNDGNVCTTDSCNPATGCVNTPNTAPCDDGNACTTRDTCAGGACVGGPAANCNDANVCTTDSCNPATGCVHTA